MTMKKLGRAPYMDVSITDEVIKDGVSRDSGHCMIAEAVRAVRPNAAYISVDLQTIRFSDMVKMERYTYLTPRNAQVALVKFDQGIMPEPYVFKLRSGHVTRAGKSKEQNEAAQKKSASKRMAYMRKPGQGGGKIPERVGGKPPPKSWGRRRSFGLRSLQL